MVSGNLGAGFWLGLRRYIFRFGQSVGYDCTSLGVVKYQEGTGQAGSINSGVGTGFEYAAESRRWKVISLLGYGFQAVREATVAATRWELPSNTTLVRPNTASQKRMNNLQDSDQEASSATTEQVS